MHISIQYSTCNTTHNICKRGIESRDKAMDGKAPLRNGLYNEMDKLHFFPKLVFKEKN